MPMSDHGLRTLGKALALLALTGLMTYGCQKARTQQTTAPKPPAPVQPAPAAGTQPKPGDQPKSGEQPKSTDAAASPDKDKPKPPIPHTDLAQDAKPAKEFLTPSGIKVQEFKAGEGVPTLPGAMVTLHYVLHIQEGWRKLESTYEKGEPDEPHPLGKDLVMADGIVGMKPGAVRRIVVPPEKAFGHDGLKDEKGEFMIPPDSTLVYDVELVSDHE